MQVLLNIGVPDVGFRSFARREKLWVMDPLLIGGHYIMARLCPRLSYLLPCVFFLVCLMCRHCLARLEVFFPEEIGISI